MFDIELNTRSFAILPNSIKNIW